MWQNGKSENELASFIVHNCLQIHRQLGPGLFESVYEKAIGHLCRKHGLWVEEQKKLRVYFDGEDLGLGFIPDIVIENKIIVEVKSVDLLTAVHFKQIQTYLKIANMKLGLLINFNVPLIKDGIHRVVNKL
jgi:GxxExxY protein